VVFRPPDERREELISVYREMCDSHACPLKEVRTKLVFGAGNANADLMFVGEAPGANEDKQGLPFVGRAGKLLDDLLAEVGIQRADTFVTNVICCRPPGNRDPLPEEIEACKPYLFRKIELIEPKVICTLGNFATKLLTGDPTGITRVHGRPQEREVAGRVVLLFPIFHPAAALRTDAIKQLLREDFAKLPALLAEHTEEAAQTGDAEQMGLFQ
jgi:DNA polymerase